MAGKKTGKRKWNLRPGKEDPASNRLFLRRTFCIMAVCGILLFIPLIITLFHMMITKHDVYESQAIANQTRSTTSSANSRARIPAPPGLPGGRSTTEI